MNNNLPIIASLPHIVELLAQHALVIVQGATGSGKSTQLPQALLDAGYRVLVTQPRKMAARTVASRVAEEMGVRLGGLVGYRTGDLEGHCDSAETKCLFCTDGLAMVSQLMRRRNQENLVLVIDEVHEWNRNIEVLVGWVKKLIAQGNNIKVVLMSATLETDKISAFFGGGKVAPIVKVPGRQFPIDERPRGISLEADVVNLVGEFTSMPGQRKILVFLPGKQQIADCMSRVEEDLKNKKLQAVLLPLHGDLDRDEQDKCFADSDLPVVIFATDIAELSVTIPGVRAVVDSGMQNRMKVFNGIQKLAPQAISLANREQRKGRAGREEWVINGIYIDHCPEPTCARAQFQEAEILCCRLESTILQLAQAGFNMEEMDLFHQPVLAEIHRAKRALINLGCLDEHGQITDIGCMVAKLPLEVEFGRMLVEARKRNVLDFMLTCAAVAQVGGITKRPRRGEMSPWQEWVDSEEQSDFTAQGNLFEYVRVHRMHHKVMREAGLSSDSYQEAVSMRRRLVKALLTYKEWGGDGKSKQHYSPMDLDKVSFGDSGSREDVLRAIVAGMVNHVYLSQGLGGSFSKVSDEDTYSLSRELQQGSVISCRNNTTLMVGMPFDYSYPKKTRFGGEMIVDKHILCLSTVIEPQVLVDVVSSDLIRVEAGTNAQYNPDTDVCEAAQRVYYRGRLIGDKFVPCPDHPEAALRLAEWMTSLTV